MGCRFMLRKGSKGGEGGCFGIFVDGLGTTDEGGSFCFGVVVDVEYTMHALDGVRECSRMG